MNRNALHPASYRHVYFWSVLIILYFATRFYNLTAFPIFSDEAIYIHWAQIISEDWAELFISKVEGKLPIYIWLVALILPCFDDPLVAGRVISIVAGIFTLLGVIHIGQKYYSPGVGWLAGIFYIACPYALHLERMALLESLLTACGVWVIIISLNIAQATIVPPYKIIALGIMMGLAFLTKATALLLIPVLIIIVLIHKASSPLKMTKVYSISLAISLLMILPFIISGQQPIFANSNVVINNPDYFLTIETLLSIPLKIWIRNFWVISDFYKNYLSITLIILSITFLAETINQKNKIGWVLISWAAIPPLVILIVANGFYSRYFLIAIPPIIIMGARGFLGLLDFILEKTNFKGKGGDPPKTLNLLIGGILLILVLINNLLFSEKLIFNIEKAPLPELDRLFYLEGMPSGFGIKKAAGFLLEESKKSPLILMTTVDWGNPQDGLSVYLRKEKNIRIILVPWWPPSPKLIPENQTFPLLAFKHKRKPLRQELVSKLENVYFLYPFTTYPESIFLRENRGFEKIWSYGHNNGKDSIDIFKLKNK